MGYALLLVATAGLLACEIADARPDERACAGLDVELPRPAQPDPLVALEWSYAGLLEARLGRELFAPVGDPPRLLEKFRLPGHPDERELVVCTGGDAPTCTCHGVSSCMSARWAAACAPDTQRCALFGCACAAR